MAEWHAVQRTRSVSTLADGRQQATSDQESVHRQQDEPGFWEWVVAALGLVLVTGMLGFLIVQAITRRATPPDIHVQPVSIHTISHGYLVEIRVRNQGNTTAAELSVEGELRSGDKTVETSETTLDYVPARSERRGGLFFTHDPRQFTLQLAPKGYRHP